MPIETEKYAGDNYWKCVCLLCSRTHKEKIIYQPSIKRSIENAGWVWFRKSLSQLDCVCYEHIDQARTEMMKLPPETIEEHSFDNIKEPKKFCKQP